MTRPTKLGLPFTHWSIRKLAACLSGRYGHHDPTPVPARMVRIGGERVRTIRTPPTRPPTRYPSAWQARSYFKVTLAVA
ncbi:MAG TPA: hypothetical protein VI217_03760 [Mycobacterium sp.]